MGRAAMEHGVIRRLSVFDHDAFTQHLLRLDADSRQLRFGMIAGDAFLIEYSKGCTRWDVVIFGYFVEGIMRGAAELRPLSGESRHEAEVAFSVESDWRGQGIGGKLFEKLIRAARNRGFRRLYMSCLATNRPMQALAHKFAADVTFERGGTTGVVDPGERTMVSLIDEAADEAAYAFATLDVPARSLADPLGWFSTR